MIKSFSENAWEDYLYWQVSDKKIVKKINELIKDIERNGNEGLGKPEPLKYELQGYWSRRISVEHRLIYSITENTINIVQCKEHY